jgi:hypothetical protein
MPVSKLTTRQKDKLIEAAQNAIEFTVEGSGTFPFDMLRYDICWPASEPDSYRLDNGRMTNKRHVKLKGLKPPTFARWTSFGWTVLEMTR